MRKYQKEYRQFHAEIGPEAFKRPLLTHRNAITTGWKRVGRVSRNNTKSRESILEEDLAKNVSLSIHNSFYLNRESRVKGLPNQAKRLQEQREWMRSYEQLKAWEEILISSDDEEALLKLRPNLVPRGRRTRDEQMAQRGNSRVLSLEREGGSRVSSDEIWVHEKEILTNQILLLKCYIYHINQKIA